MFTKSCTRKNIPLYVIEASTSYGLHAVLHPALFLPIPTPQYCYTLQPILALHWFGGSTWTGGSGTLVPGPSPQDSIGVLG